MTADMSIQTMLCRFLQIVFGCVLFGAVWHLCRRRRLPPGTKWPPGPTGLPLVGRIWDIPREHSYKRFKAWSDEHGPIFSMNIFGVNHVWLASDSIAKDLLSKRAAKHSDRPMVFNLEQSKEAPEYLPLLGYNDHWHRQRKIVVQFINEAAKLNYRDFPLAETPRFLSELIQTPDDYLNVMENYTGRISSRLAFGVPDHYMEIRQYSHGFLAALSPAANLTNIIPQLKLLPTWISPWKREEKRRHAKERVFFMRMLEEVADRMETQTAEPSFMRHVLERREKTGLSNLECSYVVGIISLVGVLNTSSTLMTYLLAMTLYPTWQTKLQVEVDKVCGERLPNMSDAPNMPVLRAVIMELLRWRPVTPSSVPHQSTEDDIYNGYFIPKGTFIHPNQWAITRDESVFPDPESFNPDRWLNPAYPSYREPLEVYPSIKNFTTFGYGRRICVGMDLVEQEFFIAVGAMAWAVNISKKTGADGTQIYVPAHDYSTYAISRPNKFAFDLQPRSAERKALVHKWYSSGLSEY